MTATGMAGTVVETSMPGRSSSVATGVLQIVADDAATNVIAPPAAAFPGDAGTGGDFVDLRKVYPPRLPGERIDDYGWPRISETQVLEAVSAEAVTAYFETNRIKPKPRPVVIVKSRRPSAVVDAIKSLPPAGMMSMGFCLLLMVVLLLKGIRG